VPHDLDGEPGLADPSDLPLHRHARVERLPQDADIGDAAAAQALAHYSLAARLRHDKPADLVADGNRRSVTLPAREFNGLDHRLVLRADVDKHVIRADPRNLPRDLVPRRKGLDLLVIAAEHLQKLARLPVFGGLFVKEAVMFLVKHKPYRLQK